MKCNLQSVKLFLVLALSCTGLVVSETLSFGRELGDGSHSKTIVAQTPRFEQPPVPPGPPPGDASVVGLRGEMEQHVQLLNPT